MEGLGIKAECEGRFRYEREIFVAEFPRIPHQRPSLPFTPPAIVWLRVGNCSRKALLSWFKPLLPAIEQRLLNGEMVIEVR